MRLKNERRHYVTVLCRAFAATLLLVVATASASAATRYDPRLRFRTITTPRFYIHFHQGEEAQARRLARIVEQVADRVNADLGAPDGRVHVILVDQTDLSNGWATPVPYNLIEITAAAPPAESIIGNADDWLRLVFTHEYTHVVHLSRKRGWIGGLRRVFGRQPLLYPNLFQPLWQIEGIATFAETAHTRGQGRIAAGDFRAIVNRAAAANVFEPLDRANGGLIDWPSGQAPYAYGGYFHQFLADRYGSESIRRLTDETARRLPYTGSRAYRTVFGKSLGQLWSEFEEDARRDAGIAEASTATRLTHHGFSVRGPRFVENDHVVYSISTPHRFPSLMAVSQRDPRPRQLAERYLGTRVAIAETTLVFDQLEYVRNVGLQSDLYATSLSGGDTWRLTSGARAGNPDVSPDGRTIVCTVEALEGGRRLATMAMPTRGHPGSPVVLAGDELTDFSSPRWSPDGRWIAAERRRVGGPSEIVLLDARGGPPRVLPSPASRNASPVWFRDGRTIVFSAAADRAPFQIYSVDIDTGALAKLEGTGPSAQSPDISPDGRTLIFVGYTIDGYDLFSMPLAGARWTPAEAVAGAAASSDAEVTTGDDVAAGDSIGVPYSPVRTLAPRFWSPTIDSDAGDLVVGAATAGADVLGRHLYAIAAGWSTDRGRPDWWAGYAYDRWWPTVFADISDDTDSWADGEIRTRELNAGAVFPFRRVRRTHTLLAAFNASSETLDCQLCGPAAPGSVTRRSMRAGWTFDSARTYGYSISRVDGSAASLSVEHTVSAFGSDGDAGAAVLDLRHYLGAAPRHAVIAARVAAAGSWGDEPVRRLFSAAGAGPQSIGVKIGSDAVGLLRGFEESAAVGHRVVIGNLDYRLPLVRVERGAGTVPIFLRTIHAAVFLDAGDAWTGAFERSSIKVAAGIELSADTVIGFVLPVTFSGGVAWRRDASDADRGFVAFGRIGRAF